MKQVICPLDGKPCQEGCPDRYVGGAGCLLSTAKELGATILSMGGDRVGVLFSPEGR